MDSLWMNLPYDIVRIIISLAGLNHSCTHYIRFKPSKLNINYNHYNLALDFMKRIESSRIEMFRVAYPTPYMSLTIYSNENSFLFSKYYEEIDYFEDTTYDLNTSECTFECGYLYELEE